MASTTMHMAITKIVAEEMQLENTERLMLGAVIPDAYAGAGLKAVSHLDAFVCGNAKKTYDLTAFRERFAEQMASDSLYLGYYLHLVQDLAYRDFVYREHRWNPYISGNVQRLHNDYALLNTYVIRKYHLLNTVTVPENFPEEPIHMLGPFDIKHFLDDLNRQFLPYHEGGIFFFTEAMADSYIQRTAGKCIRELKALSANERYMDEYEWAWDKKVKSLLETTRNTRDLGGFRTAGGDYTKYRSLLRSDAVESPNEHDIDFLTGNHIGTIIDMRSGAEMLSAPSPFAEMQQFAYHNIPVEEGGSIPESVSDVPYSYMRIAEAANMPEVFRNIGRAGDGVLFYCSAGKDRTGVVSAILLLLAGVSREDIIDNYMVTKECNKERLRKLAESHPEFDMNIVIPHEEYMRSFLDLFHEKYGNAEQYLASIGLGREEIACIRGKLI